MFALSSAGFSFQNFEVSEDEIISQTTSEQQFKALSNEEWEFVYKGTNINVFRRLLKELCIYEYRCFGSYNDISPNEFVDAQCDIDYRISWDENVSCLEILEENDETNSQVIKWVSKYPYPMYPRLYLYIRRKIINKEQGRIVVVSNALDPKSYPTDSNCVRVTNYKSKLIVSAHNDFDEDGLDYVLVYRDDPKSSIPSFAYNYIVQRSGPQFMEKVYVAAKKLKDDKRAHKTNSGQVISNEEVTIV